MKLPNTILNRLKAFIDEQVDEGIKDYPIYIRVDGKLIDYDSMTYSGGQIDIEISSPIFFSGTGDLASVELLPKEKLFWDCKYCGRNTLPQCNKCIREDGQLVADELIKE